MTITYLDGKPDAASMHDPVTTVPALEGAPVASLQNQVSQNIQPVLKVAKRGRPPGSRNKARNQKRETTGRNKRGPGRPAKARGKNRERSIRIKTNKTTKKEKKHMTTETITQTNTENRRGRKSEGKTCKLVCLITGSTRTAGSGYLSTKPSEFRSNYISRPALKLLRQGLNVRQVREQLQQGLNLAEPAAEVLQNAIALNGKHKKD